ncbi:MAG: hypothetical protein M1828_005649 [Chrysothrix sp. TS-e1954]|nr:MAG: hypothetical protein M1828_005649 [Chrysothrix sp. TS-e1954]
MRTASGGRSPPYAPKRSTSVSSDVGGPVKYINLTIMPHVHPTPAYVALSAASQIASDSQKATVQEGDDWYPEFDGALFSEKAVSNINVFLDQLMYSFLATAKSSTLSTLKPAIEYVLKGKLARQACESADEELQELLSGNEYEEELANIPKEEDAAGKFDLDSVWRRTRLRIMVYMRLGEMEDEDEEKYVEEEHLNGGGEDSDDRPFSPSSGLVSWAAAIFLTSVLEYVAEQCIIIAGHAAYDRVSLKLAGKSDEERVASDDLDDGQVMVREQDVERLALNSLLGRLWRTWRKNMRVPKNPSTSGPASAWRTAQSLRKGSFSSLPGSDFRPLSSDSRMSKNRSDSLDDLQEGDVNVIRGPVRSKSMLKFPATARQSHPIESWQPYPSAQVRQGLTNQRARSRSLPTPETSPLSFSMSKTEVGGDVAPGEEEAVTPDGEVDQPVTAREMPVSDEPSEETRTGSNEKTMIEPNEKTRVEPCEETSNVSDTKENHSSGVESALAGGAVGAAVGGAISATAARLQHASGFKSHDTSSRETPEPARLDTTAANELPVKPGRSPVSPLSAEEHQSTSAVLGKETRPYAQQDGMKAPIMGTTSQSRKQKKPEPLDFQQSQQESVPVEKPVEKPVEEAKPQNELLRLQNAFASKSPNRSRSNNEQQQQQIAMPQPKYPAAMPTTVRTPAPTSEPGSATNASPESAGGYISASESPLRDDKPASKGVASVKSPKSPNSSTWFGDAPQTVQKQSNETQSRRSVESGSAQSDKEFDDRLSGSQTVKKSLTPKNLREIEQPDSPRLRQEAVGYESLNERTAPPKPTYSSSPSYRAFATGSPARETLSRDPIGSYTEAKASRPSQAASKSSKNGVQPRDARVQTQSTGEFADYFRTVQPSQGQNQPSPLSPSASSPPADKSSSGGFFGKSAVAKAENNRTVENKQPLPQQPARGKVPKMNVKARGGRGEQQSNNDLIAFLKDGPPGASMTKPAAAAPSILSSGNRASSQTSGSVPDSINSRSGLLSNKASGGIASNANSRTPGSSVASSTVRGTVGTAAAAGAANSVFSNPSPQTNGVDSQGGAPVRKQRRVKDPYAIDMSDEEEENGSDILTGLPKNRRRNRDDEGAGESLIDFLKNNDPPVNNGPSRLSMAPASKPSVTTPSKPSHKPNLSAGLSNHPVEAPANSAPILPVATSNQAALPDFLVNSRAEPNSAESLGGGPGPAVGSSRPPPGRKEVSFESTAEKDNSRDRGRSQSASKEGRKGSSSGQNKGMMKMFKNRRVGVNG